MTNRFAKIEKTFTSKTYRVSFFNDKSEMKQRCKETSYITTSNRVTIYERYKTLHCHVFSGFTNISNLSRKLHPSSSTSSPPCTNKFNCFCDFVYWYYRINRNLLNMCQLQVRFCHQILQYGSGSQLFICSRN